MSSPPTTLGQYQIIREIARSNDIVYEAYDPLMNRRVAIKELMMPQGSTPQQREDRIGRFKREAQAAGTLNHPSIMTVYSFAEDQGHTFMAMEYLDGQTLRNELDTHGAIPVNRAVEITEAVLSGLEHAHSKGVIHRDIKPDNIQILSNGQIKITDFGIARLTFQPNLTVDGQVFGTPSYMSPEQVVGKDIDARSDIFSVGVMLYEMLTGKKPFTGDSVVSTTYAIMNADPERPSNISFGMWAVISRAVEKSPSMRWSSATDMLEALKEAMDPSKGVMPVVDPSVPAGYHPSTNPYAAAPPTSAPPIAAMYGGGAGGHNPYAPQPNPYANQYSAQPQAPLTFPYNPYQAGGGAYPPHSPGMPPGQTPVYYPPPPRRPLIPPHYIDFAKRVLVAIVTVLGLALLLFVLVQALLAIGGKRDASQVNQQPQASAASPPAANSDPATNQPAQAESQNDQNIDKNPTDPSNYLNNAKLHDSQATGAAAQGYNDNATLLYSQAEDDYSKAAALESSSDLANQDKENAIQAAINAGTLATTTPSMVREGINGARLALEDAQRIAPRDKQQQLLDLLEKLRQ
jgi:serine/threonine-protein kinase